jgi:TonB family protein
MRATGKFALWAVVCATVAATPVLAQVIWAEAPSAEDMAKFYPPTTDGPQRGLARIECRVAGDGRLSDCHILSEEPGDAGLGAYALSLAPKFRATPEAAKEMQGAVVIPVRFGPAAEGPPRRDARFQRSSAYSRLGDAGPYYPERAARMGLMSVVEADCRVADKGLLRNCKIISVSTPDYGFEFAFLKMAERGWMTAAPLAEGMAAPADGVWRFRMIFDGKRH